jgi:hypothetical protein
VAIRRKRRSQSAQHLSLACVEVLVHLDKSQLPQGYVWSKADLSRDATAAVQVLSVIIPEELNVLHNRRHTGYTSLVWSPFGSIRASSSHGRKHFKRVDRIQQFRDW